MIIGTVAGAALNAFSEGQKRSAVNNRIQGFMDELGKHILSDDEIEGKVRRTTGIFNSSLNNMLNKTAFTSRGTINAPVAKAAVAAGVEGNRLEAVNNVYNQAESYNLSLHSKIAELGMAKQDGSVTGDLLSGGIQGGIAGAQISNLMFPEFDATKNVVPEVPKLAETSTKGQGYNLWRQDSMYFNQFPKMNLPKVN